MEWGRQDKAVAGFPPVPRIRQPTGPFGGLAVTGPCPVCLFVVTLDFKSVKQRLGGKKVYMKRYYGNCPNHGEFQYGWMDLTRVWERQALSELVKSIETGVSIGLVRS